MFFKTNNNFFYFFISIMILMLLAACSTPQASTSQSEEHAHSEGDHDDEDGHDGEDAHGDEDDHEGEDGHGDEDDHEHSNEGGTLELPELDAVSLSDRKLTVVATTNIIGDVVSNIGGDSIELTTLLDLNQDPHNYEATPEDLVALEQADIIFINGWDLEEQLAHTIEENYGDKFISISAGIDPLTVGEEGKSADPHVWFSIHNVEQWAQNVEHVLHQLNPENESLFETNLDNFLVELESLEAEVEEMVGNLSADNRKLVTNHDSFGYLAAEYGFTIVGTVIPAASTSAEPSAQDLANLIEVMEQEGVCTVFGETTQNNQIAETVAAEIDTCDSIEVVSLYTGSLGDGDASSYIGMFQKNIETIVTSLNR